MAGTSQEVDPLVESEVVFVSDADPELVVDVDVPVEPLVVSTQVLAESLVALSTSVVPC